LAAGLIVIVCVSAVEAGPNEDALALRAARNKMSVGTAMMAAGALVLPLTNASNGASDAGTKIGLSLISGGAVMIWVGARQRRKALSPQTLVGVTLRDGRSISVRVRW
jgi:hypothetical protein